MALITLAEIGCNPSNSKAGKGIDYLIKQKYRPKYGVFGLENYPYSPHEPMPCFNGNVIYAYSYFYKKPSKEINRVISFFNQYQRFDHGDFKTPNKFPYLGSNDACYSNHTCYCGVTSLLRWISFITGKYRTNDAKQLINKCIQYVLEHDIC